MPFDLPSLHADLSRAVMDFLVIEGHADAAAAFAEESGIDPGNDLTNAFKRMAIGDAIRSGRPEEALTKVREWCPDIFAESSLEFALRQQQMIELIRASEIEQALHFAQVELLALVEADPKALDALEETMCLLAFFPQPDPEQARRLPSALKVLMSEKHRENLAISVNAALLDHLGEQHGTHMDRILKTLAWSRSHSEE